MATSDSKFATLTGLAVGDALGMPFETLRFDDVALWKWDGRSFLSGDFHKLGPGQWTDDTMMAKALAESLVTHRTYAPSDAAQRYLNWFRLGEPDNRGMGKTVRRALTKLDLGLPWTQSGDPDSLGTGAAMRAAPLGLLFKDNAQAAAEMAVIDARITHRHPEAVAGAVAVAVGVAALAQGRASPSNVIEKALTFIPEDLKIAGQLREAQKRLLGIPVWKSIVQLGSGFQVTQAVPAAFLAFSATETFQAALEAAIRAGGDTDTVAAITGALAGTYYGFDQVQPYYEGLEDAAVLRALELQIDAVAPPMVR